MPCGAIRPRWKTLGVKGIRCGSVGCVTELWARFLCRLLWTQHWTSGFRKKRNWLPEKLSDSSKKFQEVFPWRRSRDSSVGTATALEVGRCGVCVPTMLRGFFSPERPAQLWGSPSLLFNEYRSSFPRRVRWQWREAEHWRQFSAEVKKQLTYTSLFPVCLHGLDSCLSLFLTYCKYR